jgi:predicted phage terminase large subunit-like protein
LKCQVGSRVFAAQYQQNPTPPDGNMIKAAWLGRYNTVPDRKNLQRVVLSCDPAGKTGPRNDYTAITVIGLQQQAIYLLEVSRGRWLLMPLRDQIVALAARWGADVVVIEDTASGMSLIPMLKEQTHLDVVGRKSNVDKVIRMSRQQGRFEAGRILLPTEALWLADFENELLAFPYGRYDDQVDALLLFLDWFTANEQYLRPVIAYPEVIVRQTDPFPWEPTPRWTDW